MPGQSFPPKWHQVVRAHHAETVGYVAAQRGDCLQIRDDERRLVHGRKFQPVAVDALPQRSQLPSSWFLGVILCPGDDTEGVARWAREIGSRDLDRIHFYHTPAVDVDATLTAWRAAGLKEPRTYEVRSFTTFHHLYGRHHGDRVYQDHSESLSPRG